MEKQKRFFFFRSDGFVAKDETEKSERKITTIEQPIENFNGLSWVSDPQRSPQRSARPFFPTGEQLRPLPGDLDYYCSVREQRSGFRR